MADSLSDSKKPLASRWECANCSLPEQPGVALRPCSRCKLVRYCGTECQVQHWKKGGGHRKFCVAPDQRKPQPAAQEDEVEGPTCAICMAKMPGSDVTVFQIHNQCLREIERQ